MKDAYDVLRQKEADIVRVRHEIESLKIAAILLEERDEADEYDKTDKFVKPHLADDWRPNSPLGWAGIVNALANILIRRCWSESA